MPPGGNPGNAGNTRKGRRVRWDQDPIIRQRLDLHAQMWAECYRLDQIHAACNELMVNLNQPTITYGTVEKDRAHLRQKMRDQLPEALTNHLQTLDRVIAEAWKAFREARSSSLNRSNYLGVIRQATETKARLDGTYMKPQMEQVTNTLRDLVMRGLTAEEEEARIVDVMPQLRIESNGHDPH